MVDLRQDPRQCVEVISDGNTEPKREKRNINAKTMRTAFMTDPEDETSSGPLPWPPAMIPDSQTSKSSSHMVPSMV